MYGIASAEPFKMRIPSPDPELSGAALLKEVPDDPSRTGTIYADQFLAHKCPPSFDDLQRRQFFCVLDLRRLKYAADEIFAKKDWKLNIMNFAKEYEKSRGLIMLRYGLYEFKNVKPSEEVLKRWRAAHNLPEPEPQAEKTVPATPVPSNRRPGALGAASTKRKAEEDLAPKDNALMASTANQNKRRNVAQEQTEAALTGPAPFKKSKRKADETDEPDENQPNKAASFTFGAQSPAPSNIQPAPAMIFGGGTNGTQSNSTELKKPDLQFGAPTTGSSSIHDILTGSGSPFPAPSSIGTTPVNGTPEPQTQHDGEEAPQEQISLINGGPGEEDEMILHEVRAKAIKFVPIVEGSDDEEVRKSPWSTQGVGPLRVLKNKTSGTVRVLLRAEPRGHIAMNKAILSDVEYKAKEKTVNFVAANDEGSGLETWVLQVKKPEFAQQLAGILEANKSANKK
ncbi:PH domain-like protein [Daldinia grandis]|nr:PH domain-like protein [Daldinia grandis]